MVPPLPLGMFDIVQAMGTLAFGPALAAALQRDLAVDQVMVFRIGPAAPCEVLLAENRQDGRLATRLARAYAGHFWARDPNRRLLAHAPGRSLSLHGAQGLAAADRDYRQALFQEPHLVDKVALILRRADSALYLNFYRGSASGAFTDAEIERLRWSAEALSAVVERHIALCDRSPGRALSALQDLFRTIPTPGGAGLSAREAQTCARIVLGGSSAGIAAELGVSLHSVTTFRRRAFAKLGIRTQQALFAIVLRHAPAGC